MGDSHSNGNGNGVRVLQKVTLTFVYDTSNHQVTIEGDTMQISLAQMIAGEGLRVLDEKRRMAAAMQLQELMRQQAADAAVAAALRNGQHRA